MINPFRSAIHIAGFVSKELHEVLRQPRLLVTLIIGPFAILLLFGLGYRNEGRVLRTLYVVPGNDPIRQSIQQYAPKMGRQLKFSGITSDFEEAQNKLKSGKVDVVIVAPAGSYEKITHNQQATFAIYHNEIDPYQSDYVKFTSELYTTKLNQRLLAALAEQGKREVYSLAPELDNATSTVRDLRSALERKDLQSARQEQARLGQQLDRIQTEIIQLGGSAGVRANFSAAGDQFRSIHLQEKDDYSSETRNAIEIEKNLNRIQDKMSEFAKIDTSVLISPFRSKTENVASIQPTLTQYFAPAVIILLLQHLAISFAALSLVKEFRSGSMELFRVSPLSSWEILIGKYLGYMIIGLIVAGILTFLLTHLLKSPMLGDWYTYGLIIATLLFASLGAGFILSLLSKTDTQAIQYSMIVLLTTIFFSGFMLNIELLWKPVRAISWILPATYGIRLTQSLMLRGELVNPEMLPILGSIGVGLFILALTMLNRRTAFI